MSDTFKIIVGEKGRVVIPAEIRTRHNWELGSELILIESENGIIVTTQRESINKLRGILRGSGFTVDQYLEEKRVMAQREDSAMES